MSSRAVGDGQLELVRLFRFPFPTTNLHFEGYDATGITRQESKGVLIVDAGEGGGAFGVVVLCVVRGSEAPWLKLIMMTATRSASQNQVRALNRESKKRTVEMVGRRAPARYNRIFQLQAADHNAFE